MPIARHIHRFVSLLHRERRMIAWLCALALGSQCGSVLLSVSIHPHDYLLTLPNPVPASWYDGNFHRHSSRKFASATFTHVRNGGELGYVSLSREARVASQYDKLWREDKGVETRFYGFPFPFAGYTFRYDVGSVLIHGYGPRAEPGLNHVGRYSISVRDAAMSFGAFFVTYCTLLWSVFAIRKRRKGRCAHCGYSFVGLSPASMRCPEFGQKFVVGAKDFALASKRLSR